jgi:hypothetical protein
MNLKDYVTEKKIEFKKDDDLKYLDGVKSLLDTDAGLEVFRRILESTKVFTSCFTGNSTTFYNEGMRDVGLNVLGDIVRADPDAVSKIFKLHAGKALHEKELEEQWIKEFNNDN